MSRPRSIPSYRRHKQSGQAIVTLSDGLGDRRDVLLGKYGSTVSRAEYARVLAEWEARGRRLPQEEGRRDLSVNELAVAFWTHAEQHYRRPDGTTTNELSDYRLSLRPLKHIYGDTAVSNFGPLALKAVRQLMVDGYEHPKYSGQPGIARKVVNQRIGRIKHMFAWSVENELVPPSVSHALREVRGLQAGRSKARETEPVRPVPPAFVDETVPYMLPPVQAMVRLQQLTGMQPGEVVVMRGIDLDTSNSVWLYRPGSDQGTEGQHKTAHHGRQRVIAIGPHGQGVLRPWLRLNLHEYLFQPREAREQMDAERRRLPLQKWDRIEYNTFYIQPRKQPCCTQNLLWQIFTTKIDDQRLWDGSPRATPFQRFASAAFFTVWGSGSGFTVRICRESQTSCSRSGVRSFLCMAVSGTDTRTAARATYRRPTPLTGRPSWSATDDGM